MKVELHLHTSRYSGCAEAGPAELMAALTEAAYEAVFLTEHDRVWPDPEIQSLQRQFPAIRIFPGLERTICDDPLQHLLVLGTNDPEYLATSDAAEIILKARAAGHLTVLAHPFRWDGGDEILWGQILPDAVEYHTPHQEGAQARAALAAAAERGVPAVNGGDVHALSFVNRCWVQTAQPVREADDIRRIVLAGEYANCARLLWGVSMQPCRIEPPRRPRGPRRPGPWREDAKRKDPALDRKP